MGGSARERTPYLRPLSGGGVRKASSETRCAGAAGRDTAPRLAAARRANTRAPCSPACVTELEEDGAESSVVRATRAFLPSDELDAEGDGAASGSEELEEDEGPDAIPSSVVRPTPRLWSPAGGGGGTELALPPADDSSEEAFFELGCVNQKTRRAMRGGRARW